MAQARFSPFIRDLSSICCLVVPTSTHLNRDWPVARASWHLRDSAIIDLLAFNADKARTLRQTICAELIAFIAAFFAVLLIWGWLIARVNPGHQWWNVSHMGLEH